MRAKVAAIAALMTFSAGAAFAQDGMRGADANGDGLVTRAEAQAARERAFARLDADGSGFIDAGERPQGRGGDRLGRADGDNDGRVSRTEFLGQPMRLFERFDANDDNRLDSEELAAAQAAMRRFGG